MVFVLALPSGRTGALIVIPVMVFSASPAWVAPTLVFIPFMIFLASATGVAVALVPILAALLSASAVVTPLFLATIPISLMSTTWVAAVALFAIRSLRPLVRAAPTIVLMGVDGSGRRCRTDAEHKAGDESSQAAADGSHLSQSS